MPVFQLTPDPLLFPPAELAEPDGLLAVGGDLTAPRLIAAYRLGIFPWFNAGDPILWWSPTPRLVLFPENLHISRRLARTIRSGRFQVSTDTAFGEVIHACAQTPRHGTNGTWITKEMTSAYIELHKLGYAHSVECRLQGELAGGLYGVALGGVFFGESMFSRVRDASKVALAGLVAQALMLGIHLIDCQMTTDHLVRLGAREMPRGDFEALLQRWIGSSAGRTPWEAGPIPPS